MNTAKRLYETTVILNANLEDTQIESSIARIQEIITKNNGEVNAINRWGRKRMTYPINKKNNGFYVHIEFTAEAAVCRPLDQSYQLDEQVLRYLTIKLDKRALKARILAPVKIEVEEPIPLLDELAEIEAAPLFEEEPKLIV